MEQSTQKKENEHSADVHLMKNSIYLINKNIKWYTRLWYLISNPFRYIIKGELRY